MNHTKLTVMAGALAFGMIIIGCDPSKSERESQERARLELEERSRQETEAANKAITGVNRKLGRKPPVLDLGLTPPKTPVPASEKPKQP